MNSNYFYILRNNQCTCTCDYWTKVLNKFNYNSANNKNTNSIFHWVREKKMVCILNYLLFVEWELVEKNELTNKNGKTKQEKEIFLVCCCVFCVLCVFFSHRFISSVSMLFVYGVYSVAPSANYFLRKWVRKFAVWGSLNVNLNAVFWTKRKHMVFVCWGGTCCTSHFPSEYRSLRFGFWIYFDRNFHSSWAHKKCTSLSVLCAPSVFLCHCIIALLR